MEPVARVYLLNLGQRNNLLRIYRQTGVPILFSEDKSGEHRYRYSLSHCRGSKVGFVEEIHRDINESNPFGSTQIKVETDLTTEEGRRLDDLLRNLK